MVPSIENALDSVYGWRREWMDLLTIPGHDRTSLLSSTVWGLQFPISLENPIKLNRVWLTAWNPLRVGNLLRGWILECSPDWVINCYPGLKESQTGKGMHLSREEEAGQFGALEEEKLAACSGTCLRIHLASPAPPIWGFGESSRLWDVPWLHSMKML